MVPTSKMASMLRLIMTVTSATIAFKHQTCDAFSTCNVTVLEQPQKTVEIIEVALPRSTGNFDRSSDGNKEFHSLERPGYEIFIKPNQHALDSAGSRKIKIFVESENFNNERQFSKNSSTPYSNQQPTSIKHFEPIPLTINRQSANVDSFQFGKHSKENLTGYYKHGTHTSKDVNTHGDASFTVHKSNGTVVHTLRDIPMEVTVFGGDRTANQSEDREKRTKNERRQSEVYSSYTVKPVQPVYSSYTQEINYKVNNSQIYKSVQNERSGNTPYVTLTEAQQEPSFQSQSSYNSEVGGKKVLVFEPDTGISATQLSHNHDETVRQKYDLDYDETRASSSGRGTVIDEGRTDYGFVGAEVRKPGRNVEQQSTYHENPHPSSGKTSTNSEHSSFPATYDVSNGRGIPNEWSSSNRKPDYALEGKYPHNQGTQDTISSVKDSIFNTGLPYETVPSPKRETENRPVRQDAYTGFPESYSSSQQGYSRPDRFEESSPLPISPCKNVMNYILDENDRWYAEIYVNTDVVLTGLRLDIVMNGPVNLMAVKSAAVKSKDNTHFTVLSLQKKLIPGNPVKVEIMVKFDTNVYRGGAKPFIKRIDLNGRMICPTRTSTLQKTTTTRTPVYVFPGDVEEQKRTTERNSYPYNGPAIVDDYTTRRTTPKPVTNTKRTTSPADYVPPNPDTYESSIHSRPVISGPVPNRPTGLINNKPTGQIGNDNRRPSTEIHGINPITNTQSNNQYPKPNGPVKRSIPCGTPAVQPRPLITGGQMTSRGQWPWHAALYKNIGPNLTYSCGGSLVTDRHIVTAAHCVTKDFSSVALDPKMLLVFLGKYRLYMWTENGILNREVLRVTVHPNYNSTDFRSDIAVLTLSKIVDFTDYIRPICLWDKRNTRIDDVIGLEGTVVGWGFDESSHLTEELKQAKMPVVQHNVCLWSYPEFFPKFTSNTTYCAGFKNGTSVCNGDSGGGMFFPIKVNKEERWYLRGLVSISASEKNRRVCDTKHYVVFTDTAKYLPWLEDVLTYV